MSVASMITVFLFFVLCLSDILRLNKAASSSLSSTTSPFSSLRTLHKTNHENQSEENQRYKQQKPNIIIIIADDLGWNDVSFHGSDQIPTPNIDALAYNGVILNSHYVLPLCTPSRAALLTGKHPIHLGMQHSVILPSEPRGLPLKEKLLPEYLKEAGYVTHAVGKWHLGFYKRVYTPTYRGFDSFFGYYNGYQDYYGHLVKNVGNNNKDFIGFDMRRNLSVAWDTIDKYSTDLFTEEAVQLINTHNTKNPMFLYMAHLATHSANLDNLLQAPDEEIAKFGYIRDPERRTYAAMVSKLDQSVGEIITALRNRGMLENSIVLFISDNGAPSTDMFNNHGSNYPLRGIKNSLWEGGTHGVAAIWSPLIKQPKRVSNQLMHVTDWLPTLFSAANLDKALLNSIDGIDVWQTISNNQVSPRTEMLINIDDISNNSAIRRDDFKYLIGDVKFDSWWGENGKPSVDFGFPPPYDPSKVLQSKAGIAIAGMTTSQQIMELRKKRDKSERDHEECCEIKMLTLEEIYSLRGEAEVLCNVTKEEMIPCQPRLSPCLFNIVKDPCEMINLADSKPGVLTMLKQALLQYRLTMISSSNVDVSELSNPSRYNNTWISWEDIQQMDTFDNEKEIKPPQEFSNSTIIIASILGGLLIVGMITLIASLYQKYTSKKMKRDLNVKVNSTEVTDPIIVNH